MQLSRVQVSAEFQQQFEIANHCLQVASEEGRALIGFIESLGQSRPELLVEIEEFVARMEVVAQSQQQQLQLVAPFPVPTDLSAQQVWSTLRIIQQAVQNAIQHAGPCNIRIAAELSENRWVVSIQDSGKGFSVEDLSPPTGHFGVMSMRERAKSLAAELQIQSSTSGGTRIVLILPLPLPKADQAEIPNSPT
jgi:signal transduction histidine kinase